jgi:hypothetical protein
MARSDVNTALLVIAALIIGFLLALLIFGGDDETAGTTATTGTTAIGATGSAGATTSTTTTSAPGTAPQSPSASINDCIALWNGQGNRAAQTYLINLASQQPVRVHVGQTGDVPPQCLVTVVANNGSAYVFPEGGGSTYPYAPAPNQADSGTLPTEQKKSNALEQRDGTLAAR